MQEGVELRRCTVILFGLYPKRYFASIATNILQRGDPCCECLESPGAPLTWITEEKGGEGDDGRGDKEMWRRGGEGGVQWDGRNQRRQG